MAPFPGRLPKKVFGVFRSRHLLTDAGQVFFETREALVPSDTNGVLDVYEYEGGHVYLISSGTSSFESNLEGVSESGDDVFFRSDQQLVPQDNQEGQIVIYDARVDGRLRRAVLPAAVHDRRRLPHAGLAAALDLRGAGEPDVLRRGEPRPAARRQAEGEAQGKARKCKKGFVKKERQVREGKTGEEGQEVRPRQQEGKVMTRSRRIPDSTLARGCCDRRRWESRASPALAGEAAPDPRTHFGFATDTFSNPNGIAVEESTGDVYVADIGTDTVYKFDANGNPLDFAALGTQTR